GRTSPILPENVPRTYSARRRCGRRDADPLPDGAQSPRIGLRRPWDEAPYPVGGDRAAQGPCPVALAHRRPLHRRAHARADASPLRAASSASVCAVVRAAAAASWPLSSTEPGSPARSSACCSSSQVSRPQPTGMPGSRATRVSPSVAAEQTYSKCGVPPRITTPSATTASLSLARAAAGTDSSIEAVSRDAVGTDGTANAAPRCDTSCDPARVGSGYVSAAMIFTT